MKEKIIEILQKIRPNADITESSKLTEDHILDSMSIAMLVGELNEEFDIDITPVDLVPENFKNLDAILDLVERLADE